MRTSAAAGSGRSRNAFVDTLTDPENAPEACIHSGGIQKPAHMRRENDDFRDRYARAREGQADHYFHEMIEIADEPLKENVEATRARNRIDVRKFAVARPAPKKYGDRVSHDVQGVSNNFQPKILIQCSSGGEDEGYTEPHASPETARSVPQQGNGNPAIGGRLFRHVETAAPPCVALFRTRGPAPLSPAGLAP